MTAKEIVLSFWEAMGSNDFYAASECLSEDFEGIWPQSGELIRGRTNFAAVNSAYPASGKWKFTVSSIVSEASTVVTDVSVTDGVAQARAITFHTVKDRLICRQVEYWPDDYEAPDWRAKWVEHTYTD